MRDKFGKILVIGSGPIKIAEAAEFDYSGSQALKALREEGIESVLANPNVATVQTSYEMADRLYMLPITAEFVKGVIEKEKPDGIMLGFGGQTALSAGIDLYRSGVLKKHNVKVLGTPVEGIEKALSRKEFRETMKANGIGIPESASAKDEKEAIVAARGLGYPLMLRVSFNLGGRGSSVVMNEKELRSELRRAFAQSSIGEVLLERYLEGWKEVEYEVVRDMFGTTAVVACLENLDPMGTHTGESVVVAPAQTLDNYEYQAMRSTAIGVAEAIGLVGECNVQFAVEPGSYKFYVIETNPRMSRSSALASKATGYPLAYVSAKLALGYRLQEIKNSVSKATTAMFEPSLDYIVVKLPRWDLAKFDGVEQAAGTEMKSIGEVMSIGRSFEEALQKGLRMLDIGEPGVVGGRVYNSGIGRAELLRRLGSGVYWPLYCARAFKEGMPVEKVHGITKIETLFLEKIKGLVGVYESFKGKRLNDAEYGALKGLGFSDEQLGTGNRGSIIIKQIDTLAGEWPARTNYLYTTHNGIEDDIKANGNGRRKGKSLLIVGAGVFRIGVSVEFDWSAVSLARSAKKYFGKVAMINCNPETVSTDWDFVDELYFDEITAETVSAIYKKMGFSSVATFAGGQVGNSIAQSLEKNGMTLLGTNGKSIDIAEDRNKFSALLERLGIRQPEWVNAESVNDLRRFVDGVGFPLLVRPSYVLSGSAMKIARNWNELYSYVRNATTVSQKHPVTVSKFIKDSIEVEIDCAADGSNVIGIPMSHVEEAGVHSGDATIIAPATIGGAVQGKMKDTAVALANELRIKGPFNIQFILNGNEPQVIELNLRASRSMPFSSKSAGIDLMAYAMKGIFKKYEWNGFYAPRHSAYAVKSAQFGWSQLRGAYPHLGPEMRSTGEGAAFGRTPADALLMSWLSITPNRLPRNGALVYGLTNREELADAAEKLSRLTEVYTLEEARLDDFRQISRKNALGLIKKGAVDIVITDNYLRRIDYEIRRAAADLNVPLVLNGRLGRALADAFLNADAACEEVGSYLKS